MPLLLDCRPLATASNRGGVGAYVRLLESALAGHSGARRLVFRGDEQPGDLVFGRRGRLLFLRDRVSLAGLLRRHGIGLYHSPFYALPPRLPARTLLTVHDIIPHLFPATVGWRNRLLFRHTYASARHADLVLADSNWTAGELSRHFDVPIDRIRVLYPTLPETVAPGPPAGPPPFGLEERGYILCVSNFLPHKNVATLLEAHSGIAARVPGPLLVVSGGMAPPPALGRRFARQIASGRIVLVGWQDPPQLRALLAGARFLVFPSLAEGFGLPILEAFAAGVPVVTAAFGAMAETAGDAALLTDVSDPQSLAEALLRLWRDPALAEELRLRGHRRLDSFRFSSFRDSLREAYAGLGG